MQKKKEDGFLNRQTTSLLSYLGILVSQTDILRKIVYLRQPMVCGETGNVNGVCTTSARKEKWKVSGCHTHGTDLHHFPFSSSQEDLISSESRIDSYFQVRFSKFDIYPP